jgi:hypothetical protein
MRMVAEFPKTQPLPHATIRQQPTGGTLRPNTTWRKDMNWGGVSKPIYSKPSSVMNSQPKVEFLMPKRLQHACEMSVPQKRGRRQILKLTRHC